MKGNVLIVAAALVLVGGLGCMSHTFEYPDRSEQGPVMEESQTFFVGGLFGGDTLDAAEMCGGPVQSVETVNTIGNGCVGCLTLNIYTPNTVRVQCASGEAHDFYLDEDDAVVGFETFDSETGEVIDSEVTSDYL